MPPQVDMLSALVNDLKNLGKPYKIIVAMKGLDTGSGNPIRFSLKDAILVRSDLPPADYVVKDRKRGLYKRSLNPVTTTASDPNDLMKDFANINFRRNWMFVDMQLRGHAFRFVTTHLDWILTQQDQLAELLEVVGNTPLPVIVTGDFNHPYEDYPPLAKAGYRDAWITGDGATCCQLDMKDSTPMRNEKIDLILLRGGVSATSANLVGAMAAPCSGCTLWASDHAGVVAGLVFTSTFNFGVVSLLIAIGGLLLFAGLLLGVSRWLRRGRQ